MRKLLKSQGRAPHVMITDKLRSYDAAKREIMPGVEHRSHKGLNNRRRILTNQSGGESESASNQTLQCN
jgi:transposase-like protein